MFEHQGSQSSTSWWEEGGGGSGFDLMDVVLGGQLVGGSMEPRAVVWDWVGPGST